MNEEVTPYVQILVTLAEIQKDLKNSLSRTDDHETRIRSLETAKWKLAGFAACLGGGAGGLLYKFLGG